MVDAGELQADLSQSVAGALQPGRASPLAASLWGNAVRGRRQSVELPAAEWCSKARIQQLSSSGAEQECSLISLS